ncbi:hypothetical protein ABT364_16410 [Massilia sp. SR12]
MKCYRFPEDIDFPDLDEATKSEIDAMFADVDNQYPRAPDEVPAMINIKFEFIRKLPAKNRAMFKYGYMKLVQEYEDFMRKHPELDKD